VAEQLVARRGRRGLSWFGPNGVQLTKRVLEAVLEAEMSGHLGYDKHDPAGTTATRVAECDSRSAGSYLDWRPIGAAAG
jgi:hypothetical protein